MRISPVSACWAMAQTSPLSSKRGASTSPRSSAWVEAAVGKVVVMAPLRWRRTGKITNYPLIPANAGTQIIWRVFGYRSANNRHPAWTTNNTLYDLGPGIRRDERVRVVEPFSHLGLDRAVEPQRHLETTLGSL